MATIILMRHGKPLLRDSGWVPLAGMPAWIAAYDLAGVVDEPVPAASLAAAGAAATIVSSTLPRALASVSALGRTPCHADALYREAALPALARTLPALPEVAGTPHALPEVAGTLPARVWQRFPRLPPAWWAVPLRLAWLGGYAGGVESVHDARLRAREAAGRLIALAASGTVLLVGHGIINRMIAAELRQCGWTANEPPRHACWSMNTFTAGV